MNNQHAKLLVTLAILILIYFDIDTFAFIAMTFEPESSCDFVCFLNQNSYVVISLIFINFIMITLIFVRFGLRTQKEEKSKNN